MKKPLGVITRPKGFQAGGAAAGIKTTPGLLDVGLLVCDRPASAAAVFTTNKVSAAPVQVSREHFARSHGRVKAVVVNAGHANACTGKHGLRDARKMAGLAAELLDVEPARVLVASTGIIGQPLAMDRVESGIREAARGLSADRRGGARFAQAIMTTDRWPKEAEASVVIAGTRVRLAGVVKGAGMIAPRMATLLAFVTTDAAVSPALLGKLLRSSVDRSFNRITVDGHMSTNDTCVALASGRSGATVRGGSRREKKFASALDEVTLNLALDVVRDGEGADAELAARAVAESPLVKTALFGADPNWGRIVSAAGASGCAFREDRTSLRVNGHEIYRRGRPLAPSKAVERAMTGSRVTFVLDLGLDRGSSVVYTCDMGHAYVHLNAEYHT